MKKGSVLFQTPLQNSALNLNYIVIMKIRYVKYATCYDNFVSYIQIIIWTLGYLEFRYLSVTKKYLLPREKKNQANFLLGSFYIFTRIYTLRPYHFAKFWHFVVLIIQKKKKKGSWKRFGRNIGKLSPNLPLIDPKLSFLLLFYLLWHKWKSDQNIKIYDFLENVKLTPHFTDEK